MFANDISGEYAISLNSFVLQAQKMESTELCGSYVAKGNHTSPLLSKFLKKTKKNSKFLNLLCRTSNVSKHHCIRSMERFHRRN